MTTSDREFNGPALNATDSNERGTLKRRSVFRWATGVGAGAVGLIAGTWIDAPAAFAAPYCCDLAHPSGPWCGGKPNIAGVGWSCPRGYTKTYWTCSQGCSILGCYECAGGSSCYDAPWYCSNYGVIAFTC
jgi:hypothetical protein